MPTLYSTVISIIDIVNTIVSVLAHGLVLGPRVVAGVEAGEGGVLLLPVLVGRGRVGRQLGRGLGRGLGLGPWQGTWVEAGGWGLEGGQQLGLARPAAGPGVAGLAPQPEHVRPNTINRDQYIFQKREIFLQDGNSET